MVRSVDWLLGSCGQVRRSSTGSASTIITSAAPTAQGSGLRPTFAAQRSVRPGRPSRSTAASAGSDRTLRGRIRRPANRHSAGTRVSAAAITEMTAIAVANPNEL